MSRPSQHKEKHGKSSEISQDHHHEGTAARTRPLSFDEIMSKRQNKKKLLDDEKGITEDITVDRNTVNASERDNGRNKDSSPGVHKHLLEGDLKASSKKKEENTSMKDDNLAKNKHRRVRDSETKSKPKVDKDVKSRGRNEERTHSRRKSGERLSNSFEIEALDKHSRHLTHTDRHVDGSRRKSDREKRKDRNGVDGKNRDKYPVRRHDIRDDSVTLDRKERKESSKSRYEETKLKRRRSRSREGVDRNRRSISPLPRSQKRASYHSREQGELSAYSNKGRSERQNPDIDRSKNTNNGSSGQHKRVGGSASGLGGYSPRKRRTEAAAKTPSPKKRSPEKKSAKWDLAPKGSDNNSSLSIPSTFQLPQKTVSLNIPEAVSAVLVPSITVKPPSAVSYNILATNKNDSIDSVQLTQATRPMRRLYVENVPASASEKALMECLNNFLISSGLNHVKGTQPCISCIMHKEKGQALVEFLTPEDASAALAFDGSSFFGSIMKIRRPKDFVDLATGEPEKSVAAVDTISNVVRDSPHKIFIGGISKALSSEMIMEIAGTFGPLKAYHFENSDDLNERRAFLEYADQSVTFRACAGLNGMKLGGQVITALQVDPDALTLVESSENPLFYGIPDHAKPLLEKPTQVLKLKNLFDPENFPSLSDKEIEEVLEDVRLECRRFGTVKSVNVVKYGSAPNSTLEACEVNADMALSGSQENMECDETNAELDTLKEATDHTIDKDNGVEDDKHAPQDTGGDESCQPGQFGGDTSVENLPVKSIPESQELAQQTLKVELGSIDDKDIGNFHMKNFRVEDKQSIGGDSNLEEVSGDIKEASADHATESDANVKDNHEEQDFELGNIFEPGCVLVEFGRSEASCTAAHCLHGRLFDNRTVTVKYVPLDVYRSRFPK